MNSIYLISYFYSWFVDMLLADDKNMSHRSSLTDSFIAVLIFYFCYSKQISSNK